MRVRCVGEGEGEGFVGEGCVGVVGVWERGMYLVIL